MPSFSKDSSHITFTTPVEGEHIPAILKVVTTIKVPILEGVVPRVYTRSHVSKELEDSEEDVDEIEI